MSMQNRNTLLNSVRLPLGALAMAVALLAVPALTSANEPAESNPPASSSMPMDHAGMGDMKAHQGMSMKGDVDYDFAVNMRKHHQMAMTMAQAQLKNGKNAQMRDMANKIMVAQRKEIVELDQWIAAHEKSKAQ
jgi:uncharacterized protein (DUF305 family)